MNDYTFETLNDKEFEVLTADLLSKEFGTHIERFKAGRDGGVDGRFFEGKLGNEVVIIQCKHWLKSGVKALLSKCRSEEASKVEKLSPSRYIFITSLPLSARNKKEIFEIFSPFIKCESDILGKEDLNDLLKKHPIIERSHYKLWLSSINTLQSILHNDVLGRSEFYFEDIKDFLPKYVVTENHKRSFEKLEKLGSIIINGEPGIGKTTLAKQLCLDYANRDYQLVIVHESIVEAEQLYQKEKKQVFYFDDFLGSNFLSAIDSKKDSDIVNFMKRVSKDETKRFILTTRSNILNQGKLLSEKFKQNNIERNEYEIKIQSLTEFDKAQILYNHIYFSELRDDFVEQLYIEKRYRRVISHKNYNPRLIEFITDAIKIYKLTSPNDYWIYIENTLDNPKDIWRVLIENQISPLDRHIVMAIVLNGVPISQQQLTLLLQRFKDCGLDSTNNYPNIDNIVRGLSGSVLNRNVSENKINFSLFNPSIADFVLSSYMSRVDYVVKIIESLRTSTALSNIRSLNESGFCSYYKDILEGLMKIELSLNGIADEFTEKLVELANSELLETKPLVQRIINFYPNEIIDKFGISGFKLLELAVSQEVCSDCDKYITDEILTVLEDAGYDELKVVAPLLNVMSNKDEIIPFYKKRVVDYLNETITDFAIEIDHFDNIFFQEDIPYSEIEGLVIEMLEDLDVNIKLDEADFDNISYSLDIDRVVEYNKHKEYDYERGMESYKESRGLGSVYSPVFDFIDDLFEK